MGIRQRLALACALVHGPRVLFLDEPTSGVDPIGRRRFWKILVHLARVEQVAILITTHYMSEAEHCDHLVLMHAGRVIADDSPAALKAALQQEAWLPPGSAPRPPTLEDVFVHRILQQEQEQEAST
jgi:ABC-2 type transport system ATP-binding protein